MNWQELTQQALTEFAAAWLCISAFIIIYMIGLVIQDVIERKGRKEG